MTEEEKRRLARILEAVKISIDNSIASLAIMKNDTVIWNALDDEFKNKAVLLTAKMSDFKRIDWEEIQAICASPKNPSLRK
jgi:hypothetical protein